MVAGRAASTVEAHLEGRTVKPTRASLGVFVHNEEHTVGRCLQDLREQQLRGEVELRVFVLCNGCTDASVSVARRAAEAWAGLTDRSIEVLDLPEPGKSRTWNRFVELADDDQADVAVCVDGDIRMRGVTALVDLVGELRDPSISAAVSRPVAVFPREAPRHLPRLFENTKTEHADGAIVGSFYAARMDRLREIRLPVPCLVEDGFLAACLITDLFSQDGEHRLVRASKRVSHEFEAPTSVAAFFRHSVRVVLGTEMNAALFTPLWAAPTREARRDLLRGFARGEGLDEAFRIHDRQISSRHFGTTRFWRDFAEETLGDVRGSPRKAPLRLAKRAYLGAVRARAWKLFRERTFVW
jgi:hypothetical protein